MPHVVQTELLIEEGVLSPSQGQIIAERSRKVMVSLVINSVLCIGIIAAALGFVFWLADALAVAIVGAVFLAVGAAVLLRGNDLYRMFGNAFALIGAGMLAAGATIEFIDKMPQNRAGIILTLVGAVVAVVSAILFQRGRSDTSFLTGSILLMGAGMHAIGIGLLGDYAGLQGVPVALLYLYFSVATAAIGYFIDVRLITALAIVPFAQMLDTSTMYWHAAYAFYSPESTLSILQMTALMLVCLVIGWKVTDRVRRHTALLGIMAYVIANLCFLVGSLWGDVVGSEIWGPTYRNFDGDWQTFHDARKAFEASALVISENVYSIIWALLLIATGFWAAHTNRRGIFNAAVTFGAIHAYTQMFETFADEPLAYVVGGLAAVPLAWGMWRLNERFEAKAA